LRYLKINTHAIGLEHIGTRSERGKPEEARKHVWKTQSHGTLGAECIAVENLQSNHLPRFAEAAFAEEPE